ncbi:MAG: hypothetical protein U0M13_00965 [Desulfovibrio fairfieldensis]|nr:hypothetical protein [Desulfovibrio fairfieldensis]
MAAQPAARAFSNSFIFKFPLEHFTMNNQTRSLQRCDVFKLREILHAAKKEAAAQLSRSASFPPERQSRTPRDYIQPMENRQKALL